MGEMRQRFVKQRATESESGEQDIGDGWGDQEGNTFVESKDKENKTGTTKLL